MKDRKIICDLCNTVVFYSQAKKHLLLCHGIKKCSVMEYFHKLNNKHRIYKSWYRPNEGERTHQCGSSTRSSSWVPKIKIIYTSMESNRRKH